MFNEIHGNKDHHHFDDNYPILAKLKKVNEATLRSLVTFPYLWFKSVCHLTFAVHSNRSIRALAQVQEASSDDVAGRAAVHEEQVVVVEPGVRETLGVIDLLVETDYGGNVVLAEIREISLGCMEGITWNQREEFYTYKPKSLITVTT